MVKAAVKRESDIERFEREAKETQRQEAMKLQDFYRQGRESKMAEEIAIEMKTQEEA